MKNSEKKVKIKVKPRRMTRAERKKAKYAQKANEELQLCMQAAEFHKAYLAIQLGCEKEKFDAIQARLAALNPVVQTTEITETVETVETVEATEVAEATEPTEEAETTTPEEKSEVAAK